MCWCRCRAADRGSRRIQHRGIRRQDRPRAVLCPPPPSRAARCSTRPVRGSRRSIPQELRSCPLSAPVPRPHRITGGLARRSGRRAAAVPSRPRHTAVRHPCRGRRLRQPCHRRGQLVPEEQKHPGRPRRRIRLLHAPGTRGRDLLTGSAHSQRWRGTAVSVNHGLCRGWAG